LLDQIKVFFLQWRDTLITRMHTKRKKLILNMKKIQCVIKAECDKIMLH